MPTRRWPPSDSAASITGSVVRPMPVADQEAPSGSASTAATSAAAVPGMPPGTPITRSQCTCPPYGSAVLVEQPVQRGDVAEVEQLELRHDLALLGQLVELDHERPAG